MITLRRAKERYHDQRRKQGAWLTFRAQDLADPLANGFGSIEILSEERLPPGSGALRHPHHDAEIITYVCEGALAYEDSKGRSGVIRGGEFWHMTAGRGIRHSETNASRTDWAHVFRIWLRPSEAELESSHEQKRFSAAERRGVLCVVASPDARRSSLLVHQDALVYSAMLDPGQHVVHELPQGRSAWLHLVHGEATLGDVVLTTGDGAGVTAERAVSLTAREETELLLLDLGPELPPRRRATAERSRATRGLAMSPELSSEDSSKDPMALLAGGRRGQLVVALPNPNNLSVLDEITFATGLPVRPVLASERDIERAIARHFGGGIEASRGPPRAIPAPDEEPTEETDQIQAALSELYRRRFH